MRRGVIKNRVSIDKRPGIISEKLRVGDWEGATVIGKNHKGELITLAERKSRYVLAGHIRSQHEVFFGVEISYTKQPLVVVLRT